MNIFLSIDAGVQQHVWSEYSVKRLTKANYRMPVYNMVDAALVLDLERKSLRYLSCERYFDPFESLFLIC